MPFLYVCAPAPPWAFEDAPGRVFDTWAADARASARRPVTLMLAVHERHRPAAVQWGAKEARNAKSEKGAKEVRDLIVVTVPDYVPYERPVPRTRDHARPYTDEELRLGYGCCALMRGRLVARAMEEGGAGAVVWFKSLDRGRARGADEFDRAWGCLSVRPGACVTRPFACGGGPRKVAVSVASLDTAGAAKHASADQHDTFVLIDEAVLTASPPPGRAAPAAHSDASYVLPVMAGSLDWAVAAAQTFGAVGFSVGQVPSTTIVFGQAGDGGVAPVAQMGAAPLAGDSPTWFWGAGRAGLPVYAVVRPT